MIFPPKNNASQPRVAVLNRPHRLWLWVSLVVVALVVSCCSPEWQLP